MKKNNKPAAKRYMKTVGMVMASVMVLSSTTGQMVYAESAKDQKDTQDGEKKEEKTIVYLNGKTGNDKNSGESQDEAVKSFEKAAELAGSCGVIRICGTVTVDEEETWELPSGVSIRRAEDFEDALVRVTGCLKLDNVRLYTEDITGDGEVEGAAEKEKVQDIEVLDTGYTVETMEGGNSLIYYAVEIKNPNTYNAIMSPNIEITVLDKNERVLTKQNCSLSSVAPGDTLSFGDSINCPKGKPDKVEITVENNDYDFKAFSGSDIPAVGDLQVNDVEEKHNKDNTTFTGTITNNTDEDQENVIATVVFKRGKNIVGGVTGKIGTIEAGKTVDFNISSKSSFSDYDDIEVYAVQQPE